MRLLSYTIILCSLIEASVPVQAQEVRSTALAVGSGSGQIGVLAPPNEECRGPTAVTPASNARLAVLDQVNRKIVLVGGSSFADVKLPDDLVEPADLISTTRGYVVLGELGAVVLVDEDGSVLARTKAAHNPEAGNVRIVPLAAGGLALEEITGNRVPIDLDPTQIGDLIVPGLATAAAYNQTVSDANQVVLGNNEMSGPLAAITVTSRMRIVEARAVWASEGEGALIAVQESRLLPEEATFVRLVAVDADGRLTSEAYLGPEAFACDARRPFARLTDGRVVSLAFIARNELRLDLITFDPLGAATPKVLGQPSDATLISEDEDVFTALERLNGTPSVSTISLSPISRAGILDRARASLNIVWQLAPQNFSHRGVPNRCNPPREIWHRPPRIDAMLDRQVKAIPYRWGGYVTTLDAFKRHLSDGRLAGDDCTCRNANCVHPDATGQDCSGFVSYAWQTGNYFTTVSLPSRNVSMPVVRWGDLAPGDILNRVRSHVRLVESIGTGANGRIITVIESAANESCGGVCRRPYSEVTVQRQGYRPLRRLNLTN